MGQNGVISLKLHAASMKDETAGVPNVEASNGATRTHDVCQVQC